MVGLVIGPNETAIESPLATAYVKPEGTVIVLALVSTEQLVIV